MTEENCKAGESARAEERRKRVMTEESANEDRGEYGKGVSVGGLVNEDKY